MNLPLLYFVWALPLTLALSWLAPPWSNPDEPAHMLRVVELSAGEILAHRLGPGQTGGMSDLAVMEAAHPTEATRAPARPITPAILGASTAVRWHPALQPLSFANTAQYPPWFYGPAVGATVIGRISRMPVDQTMVLARAATAFTATLITALGLLLARRSRLALTALAIMPMTLSLDAAVGQDGLMIATAILIVGWIDHRIERGAPATGWPLAGISLLLLALSMGRPPYVPLALLVLLPGARLRWSQLGAVAAIVILVGAWSFYDAHWVTVPFPQADPAAQLRHILDAPAAFVRMIPMDLVHNDAIYLREFIGQLGWLDTPIPLWFVFLSLAVLLCAFIAAADGLGQRYWIVLLAVAGCLVLIEAVQYITWTGVGSPTIDGVQGRYLIPLAAAFILAIPAWRPVGALARPVALTGIAVLAALTPLVVIHAMVLRYYIAGG